MGKQSLLIIFLIAWSLSVFGMHYYAYRKSLYQRVVLFSHSVVSIVAIILAVVFLVADTPMVRQYAAGSEQRMDLWSLWVGLWPIILLVTFVTGIVLGIWSIINGVSPQRRKWFPISLVDTIGCFFAFTTTLYHFPSA
jgi:hypothetical protein